MSLLLFALGARLVHADLSEWRIGLWGAVACVATGILGAVLIAQALQLATQQAAILLIAL